MVCFSVVSACVVYKYLTKPITSALQHGGFCRRMPFYQNKSNCLEKAGDLFYVDALFLNCEIVARFSYIHLQKTTFLKILRLGSENF